MQEEGLAERAPPNVVREEAFETGEGPASFRWVRLKKIHWLDASGKARVWEAAERKTRTGNVVRLHSGARLALVWRAVCVRVCISRCK